MPKVFSLQDLEERLDLNSVATLSHVLGAIWVFLIERIRAILSERLSPLNSKCSCTDMCLPSSAVSTEHKNSQYEAKISLTALTSLSSPVPAHEPS